MSLLSKWWWRFGDEQSIKRVLGYKLYKVMHNKIILIVLAKNEKYLSADFVF